MTQITINNKQAKVMHDQIRINNKRTSELKQIISAIESSRR